MKKHELTENDRANFKPWAEKWIANAISTKAMDENEREICRQAVNGMYRAANLPEPKAIVFVPSPFVAAFSGGFSAAIWHQRGSNNATMAATKAATDAATSDATSDATLAATRAATRAATDAATSDDLSKWFVFESGFLNKFFQITGTGTLGLKCVENATNMWNGGNQWSGWCSYLSFFRYISKLPLDYFNWDYYEQLALHSGPRIVHEKFCIVSDRPCVLKVDDQNRPHCENGPFCKWRDGSALYSVHGVRVPAWVVERKRDITVEKIESETNAEVRRVMVDFYGQSKYLLDSGAKEVHSDDYGTLYRKEITGDEAMVMVKVVNSTPEPDGSFKDYFIRVPPTITRAREAVAWTFGKEENEYAPLVET